MPVDYDDDDYDWKPDHDEYMATIFKDLNYDRVAFKKMVKITQKTELFCYLSEHTHTCKKCIHHQDTDFCQSGNKLFLQWAHVQIGKD